jgi:GNAT superfamily N-acetyltransferase
VGSGLTVETLRGAEILPHLEDLARLRVSVFREWPYLYEGDPAYEDGYLRTYADSGRAVIVLARHRDAVVGAASALPLSAEPDSVQAPVRCLGWDVGRTFYFGESVLDAPWRGRGLGHAFMDARLAEAERQGMTSAVFCAVRRSATDPRRPANARDLGTFWRRRGFVPLGVSCAFRWTEIGGEEADNPMDFWGRQVRSAAATPSPGTAESGSYQPVSTGGSLAQ